MSKRVRAQVIELAEEDKSAKTLRRPTDSERPSGEEEDWEDLLSEEDLYWYLPHSVFQWIAAPVRRLCGPR